MRYVIRLVLGDGEVLTALETSSLEQATRFAEICNALKGDGEPRWYPVRKGE